MDSLLSIVATRFAFLILLMCIRQHVNAFAAIPVESSEEMEALITLYNSTSGSNWTIDEGRWDESSNFCEWNGICCSETPITFTISHIAAETFVFPDLDGCGASGPVRFLKLERFNMVGSLPTEIGKLQNLQGFDCSFNPALTGSIPPSLQPCGSSVMEYLNLGNTSFTGSFGESKLQNTIQTSNCSCHLLQLEIFEIPSPFTVNLETIFAACKRMVYLSAIDVDLSPNSSIPSEISGLSSLHTLTLRAQNNGLMGTIPTEIGLLSELTSLEVVNVGLSGTLPSEIGMLENLAFLYLSGLSGISGGIPSELGNAHRLQQLVVNTTAVSSTLPTELGTLSTLFFLDFSHTALSGTIPTEYCGIVTLHTMIFKGSLVGGTLPSNLGDLEYMSYFDIQHTQIEGPLPPSISRWTRIREFSIEHTRLSGPIPNAFQDWPLLSTLSFSDTMLELAPPAGDDGHRASGGSVGGAYGFNASAGALLFERTHTSGPLDDLLHSLRFSYSAFVSFADNSGVNGSIGSPLFVFPSALNLMSGLSVSNTSISGPISSILLYAGLPSLRFLNVSHCTGLEGPLPNISRAEVALTSRSQLLIDVTGLDNLHLINITDKEWQLSPSKTYFGESYACSIPNTGVVVYLGLVPSNWGYVGCTCLNGASGTPPDCFFTHSAFWRDIILTSISTAIVCAAGVYFGRRYRRHLHLKKEFQAAQLLLKEMQRARTPQQVVQLESNPSGNPFTRMWRWFRKSPVPLTLPLVEEPGSPYIRQDDVHEEFGDIIIPFKEIMIIDTIGVGATGTVSLGVWNHANVAVKRFHDVQGIDGMDTVDRRFFEEAIVHRSLRHPNIVQFLGVCVQPFCTVSELMKGGSLFDRIHRTPGNACHPPWVELPFPDRLRAAIDIATGMAYLHRKHIVHRDLKSLNVLLDRDGSAKVADFGTARSKADVDSGMMTMQLGTVQWMAPEVMGVFPVHRGDAEAQELSPITEVETYTQSCDVYSFGIVLWEIATGEVPYADIRSPAQIMQAVRSGARPSTNGLERSGHVSEDFGALMQACWRGDSRRRPSFDQVLATLLQQHARCIGSDAGLSQ